MTDSKLEIFAHIAGVLALVILGFDLYYDHVQGPDLSIQYFPSEYDGITNYDVNEDITFSFQIHNSGGKTAFVEYIFIDQITGSGNELIYVGANAEPSGKFYIDSGKTKEINITLPAPNSKITNELKIRIRYEPGFKIVESKVIPITWY